MALFNHIFKSKCSLSERYLSFTVIIIFLFAFYDASITQAQDTNQKQWRQNFVDEQTSTRQQERTYLIQYALQNDLPVKLDLDDGRIIELQSIDNGFPVYNETHNRKGAELSSVNQIWSNEITGYSLTGKSQTLGIWDSGSVRVSHNEFNGRVAQHDDTELKKPNNHATHVAGTMVASGIDHESRGMAYEATLDAYDWNDDLITLAKAINEGLNVSNHSYGRIVGWHCPTTESLCNNTDNRWRWRWYGNTNISESEDFRFGFYSDLTQQWDKLASNSKKTVIVHSAGNNKAYGPSSQPQKHEIWDPFRGEWVISEKERALDGGKDGYGSIAGAAVAKNILTVGAVNGNGQITEFSSRGPVDDGRIKPEIVAKGDNIRSPVATGDDNYSGYSGTSMAAPMVSGTTALLQEHYENLHGSTPWASTIRALLIHTADNIGSEGPDYTHGWGLMNAQKAAELLSKDAEEAENFMVHQHVINEGEIVEYELPDFGDQPIRVTLSWNDPAGKPVNSQLNPSDLMLVNDLDLRVVGSANQVYKPYLLDPDNPTAPATTGDNFRDNTEQIYIENPKAVEHVVKISHKDDLKGGNQAYSLIIEGIDVEPEVIKPEQLVLSYPEAGAENVNLHKEFEWNNDPDADYYELQIAGDLSFNNIIIEADELEESTFYTNELNHNQTYFWRARAVNSTGKGEWAEPFSFTTLPDYPGQVTLTAPEKEARETELLPNFEWETLDYADYYELQIAEQSDFINPIMDETKIEGNEHQIEEKLNRNQTYFWRVRAANNTGKGEWSESFLFTTLSNAPSQVKLAKPDVEALNVELQQTLTWYKVEDASFYEIRVADNSDFANPLAYKTDLEDTTFHINQELNHNTTYYWQVRAVNSSDKGEWANTFSFKTLPQTPQQVAVTSPENEARNIGILPEFTWQDFDDVEYYELQVAEDSDFENPVIDVSGLEDTTYHGDRKLDHEATYFWRMRAVNAAGAGDWNTPNTLTTIIKPPETVALKNPKNENIEFTPEFTWKTSDQADLYHLQLATDENFSNIIVEDSTITQPTFSLSDSLENEDQYWWRVRATNEGGTSAWSNSWSFITQTATSSNELTEIPNEVILNQNYPNPFNPTTTIEFVLPESGVVSLTVYDTVGRQVAKLVDGSKEAGSHEVTFRANNITSGVYIYRLEMGSTVKTRKFTLMK